jgi:parallel beta-helix repeat protein
MATTAAPENRSGAADLAAVKARLDNQSATTLLVDDDGEDCPDASYQSIQAAVDAAGPGATVRVCAGTYPERVNVSTAGVTLQAAQAGEVVLNSPFKAGFKANLQTTGHYYGAINVTAPFVTVERLTITPNITRPGKYDDFAHGVEVDSAGATITNNTIKGRILGVSVAGIPQGRSNYATTIANNTINVTSPEVHTGAPAGGILTWERPRRVVIHNNSISAEAYGMVITRGSEDVTITDNTITNATDQDRRIKDGTGDGVEISGGAKNVSMSNNTLRNNDYHLSVFSNHETHEIDSSNTGDGEPILYIKNASDRVFDEDTEASTLYCMNCQNVTVRNLTFDHNNYGVAVTDSEEVRVENVTASDVYEAGIRTSGVKDAVVVNNTVTDARGGIEVSTERGNVTVANNVLRDIDGIGEGVGIFAYSYEYENERSDGDANNYTITVTNNTLDNVNYGIQSSRESEDDREDVPDLTVRNNSIDQPLIGIVTIDSYGITFANNTVTDSFHGAFTFSEFFEGHGGSDHVWRDNTFTDSTFGMSLYSTHNQTLRRNTMADNEYNLRVFAGGSNHDIDRSNTVDGKPVVYLVDAEDRVIDEETNAGYVAAVDSENVTVRNLTLGHNGMGVMFKNTVDSTVENVTVRDPLSRGIFVLKSNNTAIRNSTVVDAMQGIGVASSRNASDVDNHVEAVDRTGFENLDDNSYWLKAHPFEVQDPYANGIFVFGDDARIANNTVANVTDGIILQTGNRGTETVVDNTVIQSEATVGVDWDGINRFHLNSENDGMRIESVGVVSESTSSGGISVRNNTLTGPSASGLATTGVSFSSVARGVFFVVEVRVDATPPTSVEANSIQGHSTGVRLDAPDVARPVTVQGNEITDATEAGVAVTESTPGHSIDVHGNTLPGTAEYGVYYGNPDETVDATHNYWGAANGPGSPGNDSYTDPLTGRPANGDGTHVSEGRQGNSNVRFDPWLREAPREEEPPEGTPTVDYLNLTEDDRGNNPHAMFVANWTVSDADGDLETVELTLRDLDDGEVEDSKTVDVSGETASDETRLRAHKEGDSGHTYEVELVVSDAANNTASETDKAVENGDEDDAGEGNSSAPVDPTTTSPDGTTTESGMAGVVVWQPTAGATDTVARVATGVL